MSTWSRPVAIELWPVTTAPWRGRSCDSVANHDRDSNRMSDCDEVHTRLEEALEDVRASQRSAAESMDRCAESYDRLAASYEALGPKREYRLLAEVQRRSIAHTRGLARQLRRFAD